MGDAEKHLLDFLRRLGTLPGIPADLGDYSIPADRITPSSSAWLAVADKMGRPHRDDRNLRGGYPAGARAGHSHGASSGQGKMYDAEIAGVKFYGHIDAGYEDGLYLFDNRHAQLYVAGSTCAYWNVPPFVVRLVKPQAS